MTLTLPNERASREISFEQCRAGNTPDCALFRPALTIQAATDEQAHGSFGR